MNIRVTTPSFLTIFASSLFFLVTTASASLLIHLDFNQLAEGRDSMRDTVNPRQIVSVRPTTTFNTPPIPSDNVPDAIKSRVSSSAEMRMGNIWIRNGENIILNQSFSANIWINPNMLSPEVRRQAILVRYGQWFLERTASGLIFHSQGENSERLEFPCRIENYQWQMITIVVDRRRVTVYLNGEELGTQRLSRDLQQGADFFLGTTNSTGRIAFDGYMTDFALFTSALNRSAISRLFSGRHPGDV